MQSNFYVGLSAQLALQNRMDTLAHNVANSTTVGFRAEEVKFETFLSDTAEQSVAFASPGESYLSRSSGELVKTGNALDVAVKGAAWLSIDTPAGQVYTRDGRMRISVEGELQTLNGYAVLDVGGSPLQLDPNGGAIQIARDGMITQGNKQVGAIGLFQINPSDRVSRFENSGVIPEKAVEPALDFTRFGLEQGYVENSNTNPVMEMTQLIAISRAFEAISNSMDASEKSLKEAIRSLGTTT